MSPIKQILLGLGLGVWLGVLIPIAVMRYDQPVNPPTRGQTIVWEKNFGDYNLVVAEKEAYDHEWRYSSYPY